MWQRFVETAASILAPTAFVGAIVFALATDYGGNHACFGLSGGYETCGVGGAILGLILGSIVSLYVYKRYSAWNAFPLMKKIVISIVGYYAVMYLVIGLAGGFDEAMLLTVTVGTFFLVLAVPAVFIISAINFALLNK